MTIFATEAYAPTATCDKLNCKPGVVFVKTAADLVTIGKKLQQKEQSTDQWTNDHFAVLIAPGRYAMTDSGNPYTFELGYYTQLMGVGKNRADVVVSPGVEAYNQGGYMKGSPGCGKGSTNTGNVLCDTLGGLNNFWRSLEHFTIDSSSKGADPVVLAVSQASPVRGMRFTGTNLLLCDYHTPGWNCGYTSGGFMADTIVDNAFIPGSQ